jgi:hypothetical protein
MDNRLYQRIPVEPQCRAELQFQQESFRNLAVINLGVEGCCLQVPSGLASGLSRESSMEKLELIHPSLPRASIKAKVAWIKPQGDPETGLVTAGIRFLAAPGGFTGDLAAFVRDWERYERLNTGLDGMPA